MATFPVVTRHFRFVLANLRTKQELVETKAPLKRLQAN